MPLTSKEQKRNEEKEQRQKQESREALDCTNIFFSFLTDGSQHKRKEEK
jgi:hypothetical protein